MCCSMGMQRCAVEDKLDTVRASAQVLARLCGGVCPVQGWHPFLYEARIPVMGLGAYPLSQCVVLSLEGDPVRVAICSAALTGSRVLVLPDVWSGMIMCW